MSLKVYNNEKQKWEAHSSTLAKDIKVLDVEGKFDAEDTNVENCLSEVKENIVEMNKKVNYVYENGSIGGGGGGGGPIGPQIELLGGKTEYVVSTTDKVNFQIAYSSTNLGNGTLTVSDRGKVVTRQVKNPETVYFSLEPYEKSKDDYYVTIQATDAMGFPSNLITLTITSGALSLESLMEDDATYMPGESVNVRFRLASTSKTPIKLFKKFENEDTIEEEVTISGSMDFDWTVTLPNATNIYKASIIAQSGDLETTLDIDLVVADSTTLLVTSKHPQAPEKWEVKFGQTLTLEFACYMLGQTYFDVDCYLIDMNTPITTLRPRKGPASWTIGSYLDIGEYPAKIVVKTDDRLHEKTLNFIINVTSANFTPHKPTTNNLIAHFVASNKNNEGSDKRVWANTAPDAFKDNTITCELEDYNFSSNGWVSVPRVTELPTIGATHGITQDQNAKETVLRCSGKSRAVINYSPFKRGIPQGSGLTFEIVYRTENTGDNVAKVVSCMNRPEGLVGFEIDTETALLRNNAGEQVSLQFNENEWNRVSYTIDRKDSKMKIYCNGVLTGFNDINSPVEDFIYDGPIVLGSSLVRKKIPANPATGKPAYIEESFSNFANCDIKSIRIYNRCLSEDEILDNYIADIKNEEEQMWLRKVNGLIEGFKMTVPIINFSTTLAGGDPDKTDTAYVTLTYTDNKTGKIQTFQNVPMKIQGTSSKDYPVKNYTFTLKENNKDYYGWTPKESWYPEATWTLKTNYMDSSQANNVGAAQFVHDMSKSLMYPIQILRADTGERETRTSVDGFPVIVRKNDKFHGLYTMNIDRYSYNNFGFIDVNPSGVIDKKPYFCYEVGVNNSSMFDLNYVGKNDAETAALRNKNFLEVVRFDMKHRYNGRTDKPVEPVQIGNTTVEALSGEANHVELMNLLSWLGECTDDEAGRRKFKDELKYHFSVPHLVRYFLICYALGMIDSLGKNMTLAFYGKEEEEGDNVERWYPTFYDMDSIIGVNNSGRKAISPGIDLYTSQNGFVDKMKIWRYMYEDIDFFAQIKNEYIKLRTSIEGKPGSFSLENIMSYFGGRTIDTIGQKQYNQDADRKYLNLTGKSKDYEYLCQGNKRSFTERWIRERLLFLDSVFEYSENPDENDIISLRTNRKGKFELKIQTYSPQVVKIKYSSTGFVTGTADKNGHSSFTWETTNDTDNDFYISGASNIMDIEGLKELDVSEVRVSSAEKLVNLDLSNNKRFLEIELGNNRFLRTLNLKDCTSLGSGTSISSIKKLNLQNAVNLRELYCNNTKIEGIDFPTGGGVLEEIDAAKTNITSFNMEGQEYLKELNIQGCPELNSLLIKKCQQLEAINAPGSKLKTATIESCQALKNIDLSGAAQLETLEFADCKNIEDLNLSSISNRYLSEVNLSTLENLKKLNIASSSIRHVVFGIFNQANFNKLQELNAEYSLLTTIRYGLYSDIPTSLNLSGLPLSKVSFRQCTQVQNIIGIDLDTSASHSERIFEECKSLVSISGKLKLGGSMYRAFYNCNKLTTLPTGTNFNLSNVTSLYEAFRSTAVNSTVMKNIFQSCSSKLTNANYAFTSCPNITTMPFDTFKSLTGLSQLQETFNGCTNLAGSIPHNLLSQIGSSLAYADWLFCNTKISGMKTSESVTDLALDKRLFELNSGLLSTHRMFHGAKINKMPNANLFEGCRNLTSAAGMFVSCPITGSIPETLFHNTPNISTLFEVFNGTQVSGPIPPNLFNVRNGSNNNISRVDHFFSGTQVTGAIPPNLLAYSPGLQYVSGLFRSCTGLTGTIPEGLFGYSNGAPFHRSMIYMNDVFAGCSGLGTETNTKLTIPPNMFKGKTSLQEVAGVFEGLSRLEGEIPVDLFRGCKGITTVARIFKNCTSLNSEIPDATTHFVQRPHPDNPEVLVTVEEVKTHGLLSEITALKYANEMFYNCYRMTSKIPPNIFFVGERLDSIAGCFYGCQRMSGWIPEGLLRNCLTLTNASSLFARCCSLVDPLYDETIEEHSYLFPKDLFKNCVQLKNISYLFDNDARNEIGMANKGAIHEESFINCNNLTHATGAFRVMSGITGPVSGLFNNKPNFAEAEEIFRGTSVTDIDSDLFKNQASTNRLNLTRAFSGCTSLKTVFDYENIKAKAKAGCFSGCTALPEALRNDLLVNGWM